jgi:GMP synthase (glutamine-hydrolysing)
VAAFRAGERAWGIQFHPEVDGPALDGWYARYGAWLSQAGVSEARARAADERHLPGQAQAADRLFGAFARVVEEFAAARRAPARP